VTDLVGGLSFKIDSKPAEEGANRVIAAFENIRSQADKKIRTETVGYFEDFRKALAKLGTAHLDLSRQITEVNKLGNSLSRIATENISGTLATKLVKIGEAIEKLGASATAHSGLVQNVNNLTSALSSLSALKPPSRVAITNITDFFKAVQGLTVPRNLTSIGNLGAAFSNLGSVTAPSAATVRNLRDFFAVLNAAPKVSVTTGRNITALMGAFHAGSSGPTAATVKNFREFFNVLGAATVPRGASAIATALAAIATNASHAAAAVAKLNVELNALRGFSSRISVSTRTAAGGFSNMTSGALSLESALFRTQGALQALGGVLALREITQQIVGFQQISAGLTALTGDSEKAAQELEYVRSVAKGFGVDFQTAAKNFTQFTAAIQGTNFTAVDARKIFEDITKTSRVLGLSVADTDGVFRALTQIISKGSLQMEELRGQLGDRIPGAVNKMAQALGVSTAELVKMTKQGEVTGETLRSGLLEFARLYAEQSGPGLARSLNGLAGTFANLGTTFSEASVAIGRAGLTEAIINVTKAVSDLLKGTAQSDTLKIFGRAIIFIADAFAALIRNLDLVALTVAIGGLTALLVNFGSVLAGIGAAIAANPIGLIIIAVVGLTAALGAFNTEANVTLRLQDTMDATNEALARAAQTVDEQYKSIMYTFGRYNAITGESIAVTDEFKLTMDDLGKSSYAVLSTQMLQSSIKVANSLSEARNQMAGFVETQSAAGRNITSLMENFKEISDLSDITNSDIFKTNAMQNLIDGFQSGEVAFDEFNDKFKSAVDDFSAEYRKLLEAQGLSSSEIEDEIKKYQDWGDQIRLAASDANAAALQIQDFTKRIDDMQHRLDVLRTGDPVKFLSVLNSQQFTDQISAISDSFANLSTELKGPFQGAIDQAFGNLNESLEFLKSGTGTLDQVSAATSRVKLALFSLNDIYSRITNPVVNLTGLFRDFWGEEDNVTDSTEEMTKAMQAQLDKLNEQVSTMGMTTEQLADFKLSQIDWTNQGQSQIDVLDTINSALKDYESALKSGEAADIASAKTALMAIDEKLKAQQTYSEGVQAELTSIGSKAKGVIDIFLAGADIVTLFTGAIGRIGVIGTMIFGDGITAAAADADNQIARIQSARDKLAEAMARLETNTHSTSRGGGGGGSTSRQGDERQSAMEQLMAKLTQQVSIEQAVGVEQAKQKALLEGINAAKSDYNAGLRDSLQLSDEETKKIETLAAEAYARDEIKQILADTATEAEKLAAAYAHIEELKQFATPDQLIALNKAQEDLNKNTDYYRTVVTGVGNAFKDAFEAAILKAENLNDVLINLLNTLAQIAWQQGIAGPLGDYLGGLLDFGSGAVFGKPSSSKPAKNFAPGDIFSQPTMFHMQNEKIGRAGEAGKEGLVPLTRMSNGDLGVATAGGGGGTVAINAPVQINIHGGSEKDKEAISDQIMRDMDQHFEKKVVSIILNERRPGGALT